MTFLLNYSENTITVSTDLELSPSVDFTFKKYQFEKWVDQHDYRLSSEDYNTFIKIDWDEFYTNDITVNKLLKQYLTETISKL